MYLISQHHRRKNLEPDLRLEFASKAPLEWESTSVGVVLGTGPQQNKASKSTLSFTFNAIPSGK